MNNNKAFEYSLEGSLPNMPNHDGAKKQKSIKNKPDLLVITGNGFDSNHSLPTKYSNFKEYLCKHYTVDEDSDALIPEPVMLPDGGEKYDEDEVASYIVQVINWATGDIWGKREDCLANQLFSELKFELRELDFNDKDNEIGNDYDINTQLSDSLRYTFSEMKRLFWKWVHEELGCIEYEKYPQDARISSLLKSEVVEKAVFLNFNYTYTLERLYHIPPHKVLHIHGNVDSPDEGILFGHADDTDVNDLLMKEWGAEENLNDLKRFLRKDTENAIRQNQAFFDGLSSVKDIYSYGFSFSDADKMYLEEIERHLDPKQVTWHINSYDAKNHPQYRTMLEKRGYTVIEANW